MAEDIITTIKDMLGDEKLVLGTEKSMDLLRKGKLKTIVISSNAPEVVKEDIETYASMNKTQVIVVEENNEQLGTVCKKPFAISVLSITQ